MRRPARARIEGEQLALAAVVARPLDDVRPRVARRVPRLQTQAASHDHHPPAPCRPSHWSWTGTTTSPTLTLSWQPTIPPPTRSPCTQRPGTTSDTALVHDLLAAQGKAPLLPGRFPADQQPAWEAATTWIGALPAARLTVLRAHRLTTRRLERLLHLRNTTGIHLTLVCHRPPPDHCARPGPAHRAPHHHQRPGHRPQPLLQRRTSSSRHPAIRADPARVGGPPDNRSRPGPPRLLRQHPALHRPVHASTHLPAARAPATPPHRNSRIRDHPQNPPDNRASLAGHSSGRHAVTRSSNSSPSTPKTSAPTWPPSPSTPPPAARRLRLPPDPGMGLPVPVRCDTLRRPRRQSGTAGPPGRTLPHLVSRRERNTAPTPASAPAASRTSGVVGDWVERGQAER